MRSANDKNIDDIVAEASRLDSLLENAQNRGYAVGPDMMQGLTGAEQRVLRKQYQHALRDRAPPVSYDPPTTRHAWRANQTSVLHPLASRTSALSLRTDPKHNESAKQSGADNFDQHSRPYSSTHSQDYMSHRQDYQAASGGYSSAHRQGHSSNEFGTSSRPYMPAKREGWSKQGYPEGSTDVDRYDPRGPVRYRENDRDFETNSPERREYKQDSMYSSHPSTTYLPRDSSNALHIVNKSTLPGYSQPQSPARPRISRTRGKGACATGNGSGVASILSWDDRGASPYSVRESITGKPNTCPKGSSRRSGKQWGGLSPQAAGIKTGRRGEEFRFHTRKKFNHYSREAPFDKDASISAFPTDRPSTSTSSTRHLQEGVGGVNRNTPRDSAAGRFTRSKSNLSTGSRLGFGGGYDGERFSQTTNYSKSPPPSVSRYTQDPRNFTPSAGSTRSGRDEMRPAFSAPGVGYSSSSPRNRYSTGREKSYSTTQEGGGYSGSGYPENAGGYSTRGNYTGLSHESKGGGYENKYPVAKEVNKVEGSGGLDPQKFGIVSENGLIRVHKEVEKALYDSIQVDEAKGLHDSGLLTFDDNGELFVDPRVLKILDQNFLDSFNNSNRTHTNTPTHTQTNTTPIPPETSYTRDHFNNTYDGSLTFKSYDRPSPARLNTQAATSPRLPTPPPRSEAKGPRLAWGAQGQSPRVDGGGGKEMGGVDRMLLKTLGEAVYGQGTSVHSVFRNLANGKYIPKQRFVANMRSIGVDVPPSQVEALYRQFSNQSGEIGYSQFVKILGAAK